MVTSRSASSEKLSLPPMVKPFRAGGLTSSTTSTSSPMVTLPPAFGTAPPAHVDGSDHAPLFTASWAWTLKEKTAAASTERCNKRLSARMESAPPPSTGAGTFPAFLCVLARNHWADYSVLALSQANPSRPFNLADYDREVVMRSRDSPRRRSSLRKPARCAGEGDPAQK